MIHFGRRAFRQRTAAIALCFLLAWCPCVFALAPSLDASQYTHTAWKVREGFSKGIIFSIAQTPDGYLWLGTEFGLLRFDGVRNTTWQPPAGERLPSSDVRTLRVTHDGRLWIGTTGGLASWKDGQLTHYPELDGQIIEALLEDREGTTWVGVWAPPVGRLCKIQSGRTQCYGEDGRVGSGVTSLYEDSGGNLWAGGMTGLWRWKPGPPKLYPMPEPTLRINAVIEDDGGGLLIAKRSGITRLKNGKIEAYPLPAGLQFKPDNFLRDRNGGLWIGASVDQGLMHVHEGRTDLFTRSDGMSGDAVTCFFEDREGNIWAATVDGLDRFREPAIPTISVEQGLSSRGLSSILAARDGSVWLGTSYGLNRWKNGQLTIYGKRSGGDGAKQKEGSPERPRTSGTSKMKSQPTSIIREISGSGLPEDEVYSLFEDDQGRILVATARGVGFFESDRFTPMSSLPGGIVYSITGDNAGNIWISHAEGLFRLLRATVIERIPWAQLGRKEVATAVLLDPVRGGLWLGFRESGIAFFKEGQLRASYAEGEGTVNELRLGPRGALWAATQGGLSRIEDGHVATLTQKNGLPCDAVQWTIEDDDHNVWLYMACGLVRIAKSELDVWAADPKRTVPVTVFDSSDGVRSHSFTIGFGPRVAKSADGKLWFLPGDGVSIIDPHHLPFNQIPPPVHIEQIIADDSTYNVAQGLRLPPRVRNLEIHYTALSLVAPEKVRFRIKLEGQEGWRELVDRHENYTNLGPGNYRFRVIASNNSGVWNQEGATLEFAIAPAYWQTNWFRALCVVAFLALVYGAYRFRVRQLRRQERKLRDVVETIPTFAWTALPDGSVDFVNRHWQEYTGLPAERAVGSGWQGAIHAADLKRHAEKWRVSLATGEPFENELRYRRAADEQYRWFLTRAVPLRDQRGKILKWYGTSTDIEDRKRAEQALQRSQFYIGEGQRVAHMGSWALNAAGFEYWSSELFRIYGLDPGGKPPTIEEYLALVHPEDREFMKQGIAKMLDDHLAFDFTKRIVRPDGEIRQVRCVGVPVTQGGIFQGFLGTGMDVTEQERLTEELRQSERYLSEAQSLAHTGSCAIDGTSRETVYWSDEMFRLFGFDPQQGLPMFDQWLQRIHPEDRDKVKLAIKRTFFTKVNCDVEFRIVKPDGTVKHIHGVGHPVLSATGELVQVLGTMVDVTERKRAEEARDRLRQLEADLAHINRVSTLGEMAASLAHEIKQPIAAAITSANSCIEWLAHEPPNVDRARAAAARIDKYGNRATEIIERIRSFYKKSPPQHELVDVNGIIQEMLTLLKGEADRYSVAMRTELSAELPKIMADRVQLQQVFMNLMLNAIEAMKAAGGDLMVKSQADVDGQLLFSVSDTGVGLPTEKMDQIFSAFFTTKPQGSGMGLAISRSIVESHGGRLWAAANDGRGATFHFTLPTAKR